jgi:GDP-4-dehydro-6-deoxy-D-mannose reductase
MKALITGIEGFVGPYLAEELIQQDIEVTGTYFNPNDLQTDRLTEVSLEKLDVRDINAVEGLMNKKRYDYLFHLAAQSSAYISWKKPQMTMDINVIGTINLLETIRNLEHKPRIILIGSSEEYGIIKKEELPINEKQELRPGNPYSVSKITQEKLAELYVKAYGLDIVMARSFNHTGVGQKNIFVIPDFIERLVQLENGESFDFSVGNLEAKRDFLDVRDVVNAYYIIAHKGEKGNVYNVGSGESHSIQNLLDYMISQFDMKINVTKDPDRMRPSDNPDIVCDNGKLRALGWEKIYTVYNTIDEMISDTRINSGGKND